MGKFLLKYIDWRRNVAAALFQTIKDCKTRDKIIDVEERPQMVTWNMVLDLQFTV